MRRLIALCSIIAFVACTSFAGEVSKAAEDTTPIKQIGVYVVPYYEAAKAPEGQPKVAAAKAFDAQLFSKRKEDILAVRDTIQAAPQGITPMTLMVLTIRLYDVGLRDDSVFWFYVAKNRYFTMAVSKPCVAQGRRLTR